MAPAQLGVDSNAIVHVICEALGAIAAYAMPDRLGCHIYRHCRLLHTLKDAQYT